MLANRGALAAQLDDETIVVGATSRNCGEPEGRQPFILGISKTSEPVEKLPDSYL
jgi:hypothetical protein